MNHERFYSRVNGPTLHRVNAVRWLDEVSPRHLAGGGDPRHVTEHLLASGWSNHSVVGFPHVLLESPDHHLHLTLEPEPDERSTWWRIHPAEDRAWVAQFGGNTPAEVIAGFTDALTSTTPQHPTADLWRLAASRGWATRRAGRERAALSPDETAVLARVSSLSETPRWRWDVEVSIPLSDTRRLWVWGASIEEAAPAAALAGFVDALTDPTPLLRAEGQTTGHTFGFLNSLRSTVTPEQHRLLHLQRLQATERLGPPEQSPATPPPPQGSPRHRRRR
ncbi:DUF317 domain-containing protein [Streptomyces sp. TRM66268-LWL]|uniref:DUF317 domain-containing protein n=1 Tax=Streptomyces polyasparticus TaxID=2767826 RepID=A0ABR7SUX0_9ACTN|nr:DUF317 domain-containing protein [Streptomyces polyasparticus]MBC9719193.1 DUF317 domain-containing protein [Streptomyces polyasparticus]